MSNASWSRIANDDKRDKWNETNSLKKKKRRIKLELESAKFQNQEIKYDELRKKEYEAKFARHKVRKEVKFAKQKLKVAQLNNLKEIVEINMTQKEIRFAQIQFEKKRESTEKIELKRK